MTIPEAGTTSPCTCLRIPDMTCWEEHSITAVGSLTGRDSQSGYEETPDRHRLRDFSRMKGHEGQRGTEPFFQTRGESAGIPS